MLIIFMPLLIIFVPLLIAHCTLLYASLFIGLFVVVHSKLLAECFGCVYIPGSLLRTGAIET